MASSSPVDILFINPTVAGYNYPHAPLGLAELKAFIQARGFSAAAYDAWGLAADEDMIANALVSMPARAIGITVTSFTLDNVKRIVALARRTAAHTPIICGGPHPSYDPANFLRFNPDVDAVVFGEGEETLAELLKILNDRSLWRGVQGLAYRLPDESATVNPPRNARLNLDDLPFPDFASFPLRRYKPHAPYGRRQPFFNLITSRGCPFACSFCSNAVFGRHVRLKSAGRVFEEVSWVHREFGAREVHFYDDVFTINKDRASDFCERMIASRLPVGWSMTTRVDLVSEELLRLAYRAGCRLVTFGVESGDDAILLRAGKSYTTEQIGRAHV
jgi:anaerobic magnesium-protoporphyrin IX monomethyl ester cyclase